MPVSHTATVCHSGTASADSAALYIQSAAAVSASAPGSLLSLGRGRPRLPEQGWTDESLWK